MFLAGQAAGYGATDLYSASLPPGAPLSAAGWTPTRNPSGEVASLAGRKHSQPWDGNGGRHCPAYVQGWDPSEGKWVERIYYAGAADHLWGPYSIGFLQWDGDRWVDQSEPAFTADETWEHGSVYERTSSTTTESGGCGTSRARIRRTISSTGMRKATTAAADGANMRPSLLRR